MIVIIGYEIYVWKYHKKAEKDIGYLEGGLIIIIGYEIYLWK